MSVEGWVDELVERQHWMDPVADVLQELITSVYEAGGQGARVVKNALHGTWMGHPLHPVLTDVPIGAWTVTAVLDLMEMGGDRRVARAADASLVFGLLGALGAAAAGLTDWQHVDGRPRRTGLLHALLNVSATSVYTGSLLCRLRGHRGAGRALAGMGSVIASGSSYLGGHLVFGDQIGVDHTAELTLPQEFVAVMADSELAENKPTRSEAAGVAIVLVRVDGRTHALAEKCSHLGGPLAEGYLERGGIVCPWHGSRFALEDGRPLDGPSTYQQPCLEVRVRDGQIEVRAAIGQ